MGGRLRLLGLGFLAVVLVATTVPTAQIPFQPGWKYRSGQNVVPAFEGWEKNADGSFDMIFGYYNRNFDEAVDIPIGSSNGVDPGGPDQGQPTVFLPARHRFFFSVRVPKDWPATRKLAWTLTIRGKTEKANGFLLPEWELNTAAIQGSLTAAMDSLNKAPEISVEPAFRSQTITLPATATLTASATDDGRPVRRPPGARGAGAGGGAAGDPSAPGASPPDRRGQQAAAPSGTPSVSTSAAGAAPQRGEPRQGGTDAASSAGATPVPVGLRIEWVPYREPVGAKVSFAAQTVPVADGKASTVATFSMPGRYVVRAFANDGAVWTPADLTVIVNPSPSAGR
jgi:hypothetical protein